MRFRLVRAILVHTADGTPVDIPSGEEIIILNTREGSLMWRGEEYLCKRADVLAASTPS